MTNADILARMNANKLVAETEQYLLDVTLAGHPQLVKDPCVCCKHSRSVHEHYRAGADCSLCGCDRYEPLSRMWPVGLVVGAVVAVLLVCTAMCVVTVWQAIR